MSRNVTEISSVATRALQFCQKLLFGTTLFTVKSAISLHLPIRNISR